MCSPLAVASLALTAGGTGASIAGQKRSLDAQDDAIQAESIRQQRLDADANAAFYSALDKLGAQPQKQALQAAETQRVANVGEAIEKAEAPVARQNIEQGSPAVIKTEVDNANTEARSFARALAERGALLGAGNDLETANRLGFSDAANRVNTLANFKAGSASVNPIELAEARTKGGTLRGLGDMLNAAGMLAGFGALAKAPAAASAQAANQAKYVASTPLLDAGRGFGKAFIPIA